MIGSNRVSYIVGTLCLVGMAFFLFFDLYTINVFAQVTLSQSTATKNNGTVCIALQNNIRRGFSDTTLGSPWGTGEVSKLQNFLYSQGYITADMVTGFFGPVTERAVIAYQSARSIDATGFVGPITRASLQVQSCGGTSGANNTGGTTIISSRAPIPTSAPTITRLTPGFGPAGTQITVTGTNFHPYNNTVIFGGHAISNLTSIDGKSLSFTVPQISPSCPEFSSEGCTVDAPYIISSRERDGIVYQTFVATNLGASRAQNFKVTSGLDRNTAKAPELRDSVTPTEVRTGRTGIWILKIRTATTTGVTISTNWGDSSGSSASKRFTSIKNEDLVVTLTHVYTNEGTYTPKFTLTDETTGASRTVTASRVKIGTTLQPSDTPRITEFIPASARVGGQVAIIGKGFTPSNNDVNFGAGFAVKDVESFNNGTLIYVTIPSFVNPCELAVTGVCNQIAVPVTPAKYNVTVTNGVDRQTNTATITIVK